jgi:hypothetical protein
MSPREHIAGHMSSKVINKRQAEAIIFDTVPVTNMLQNETTQSLRDMKELGFLDRNKIKADKRQRLSPSALSRSIQVNSGQKLYGKVRGHNVSRLFLSSSGLITNKS